MTPDVSRNLICLFLTPLLTFEHHLFLLVSKFKSDISNNGNFKNMKIMAS